MKKYYFLAIAILFPALVFSQVTITHAEDFTIGTKLFFRVHTDIKTGIVAGPNQTWDYSKDNLWDDSMTEWMVLPSATTHGKDFPNSNMVEKYSNGSFVYMNKTSSDNNLLAYVDTTQSLFIKYPNPVLFCRRPFSYGDKVTDTFTTNASGSGFAYKGRGICTIEADAYGTLKLPNGTFPNVLHIKISQTENDTLSGGSNFPSVSVSHVWFDSSHTSALLKIDSNSSGKVTLSYLVSETTSGIEGNSRMVNISLKANINNDNLMLFGNLQSGKTYKLSVCNSLGQNVYSTTYIAEEGIIHSFKLPLNLGQGIYIATMQSDTESGIVKVVK